MTQLDGDGIRLLIVSRHGNKLKPGHLHGNRFRILVRDAVADAAERLPPLIERLRRRGPEERCVVLATGDPLFYGIGHALGHALGRDQIRVEPALSSLQLAFARAGVSCGRSMIWSSGSIAIARLPRRAT